MPGEGSSQVSGRMGGRRKAGVRRQWQALETLWRAFSVYFRSSGKFMSPALSFPRVTGRPLNSSENEINFELWEGFIVNPSQSSHSFLNDLSNEKCGNSSFQKDRFQLAAPFSWFSNSTHIQVFLMGSCLIVNHSSRSNASWSGVVGRPFLLMF